LTGLTHDLARQDKAQNDWAVTLLGRLRGSVTDATLQARMDVLAEGLARDESRLDECREILFSPDVTAYGARATAIFQRWEEEDGGPSMVAFWKMAAEYFGLDTGSSAMDAAMIGAVLAEVPNSLAYHGNEHYRKVMFHMIRLLAVHQHEEFKEFPVLDGDDLFAVLIAATIHDIGHEGGDNLREGIYTPGYMEQKAFDLARPYFEAADLDPELRGIIETLVFCTDITFFAGDNSPCVRMKKIYRHFFVHDLLPEEDIESMMIGKLRRFEDNPKLALMSMMLHEADVGTSAGLSYEQSQLESIRIMQERDPAVRAGPKGLLRFLMDQMDGTLYSPAGRILFLDRMEIIMQQAYADIESGVESF
jgi:hypothetical protein